MLSECGSRELQCLLVILSASKCQNLPEMELSSVPSALSLCHHRGNGIKVVIFRAEVLTTGSDSDAI